MLMTSEHFHTKLHLHDIAIWKERKSVHDRNENVESDNQ